MNAKAPRQIQDLVSETVHTYSDAQIELDPLPSGVCFLWVTVNGHNLVLEFHPVEGTGVSENTADAVPFAGHEHFFPKLDEAISSVAYRAQAAPCHSVAIAPPLREPAHITGDKWSLRLRHDTRPPTGKDPGNNPHKNYPHRSKGQISDIDLQLSFACLTNCVSHLFLLVMVGISAIATA
jgi:hypothetical protein